MIDPRCHLERALFEFATDIPADGQFGWLDRVVAGFRAAGNDDYAAAFDIEGRQMLRDWPACGFCQRGRA